MPPRLPKWLLKKRISPRSGLLRLPEHRPTNGTLWTQTVLAFDMTAARTFGALKAALERRGTPLVEPDLRIASIALSRGLILVTRNVRHFQRGDSVSGLSLRCGALNRRSKPRARRSR
jgi:predicted nucleic acid-binding protein